MTVQARPDRDRAQDVVWDKVKAKAEAEWAVPSPQVRAEIVFAQAAEQRSLMLPDSRAINEAVLNVVRK